MIPALAIISGTCLVGYALFLLNDARLSAERRERATRVELYSVLGKTEAVNLVVSDARPTPGTVRYVGDEEALKLQRSGGTPNES